MASATPHVIVLQNNNPDNASPVTHERACQSAVTVTPGMLLVNGTLNTVKPHATADGTLEGRKVAIQNEWSDHALLASTNGPNIDHPYQPAEGVYFVYANSGDLLYMFLAASVNAAKGAALVSNGDGTLKVASVGAGTLEGAVFGYAAEAVDNSGGGSAVRIRVRAA